MGYIHLAPTRVRAAYDQRPGGAACPELTAAPHTVPGAADLVADYERMAGRRRAGLALLRNAAWAFLGRWPDPAAFAAEPLARRLRLAASQRPFVTS